MPRAAKKGTTKSTAAEAAKTALPKPWGLFKQTLRDYRANWRLIVGICSIIIVPVALLSNFGVNPASDSTFSAYLGFAQLCMNVALIYVITELLRGRTVSIRQAYYKGSAMLVRLVLVSVLLFLMGIFLLLAGVILGYGAIAPGVQLTGAEQALVVLLAIAVAAPSVILLTRGLFAVYAIFETAQGPIQAVRTSRRLTKGRVVATLGRLLALLSFLILLLILPIIILVPLQTVTHWTVLAVLLQIATSLIVLPVVNLYLYRYYQGLK